MENRRAPAERRENKSVVSNNVKKAPRETASVGIPRNAAAEARRLPQQPTGRQIEKRKIDIKGASITRPCPQPENRHRAEKEESTVSDRGRLFRRTVDADVLVYDDELRRDRPL